MAMDDGVACERVDRANAWVLTELASVNRDIPPGEEDRA
jgi:hypothetical protein